MDDWDSREGGLGPSEGIQVVGSALGFGGSSLSGLSSSHSLRWSVQKGCDMHGRGLTEERNTEKRKRQERRERRARRLFGELYIYIYI